MEVEQNNDSPIVHGYYRYTDIFFEWHQVVDKDIGGPLKALLTCDALVHPGHPLRKKDAKGVELYMGILVNGESRLLFSTQQIEYIRYWLHAMKLTQELLPLPHSSCMFTREGLQSVSPVEFSNATMLKNRIKEIDKVNKRLKGASNTLMSRRLLFEQVRTYWRDRVGTWCAIDFEGWEWDHSVITELGYSFLRHERDGTEKREDGHIIIREHKKYYNGKFVPDQRQNYQFGTSEELTRFGLKDRVHALMNESIREGPLFLIFHDPSQDIKYLRSKDVQAPLEGLADTLPETCPEEGIYVIDTVELFAGLEGNYNQSSRSLLDMCRLLDLRPEFLHNAGNDAHWTFEALKEMASGDPIDAQREVRWPGHLAAPIPGASGTLNVNFQPWEEDSDYSDTEGILRPYDPKTGYLRGHEPTPEANAEAEKERGMEKVDENGWSVEEGA